MRSIIIGVGRRGGDCAAALTGDQTGGAPVLFADTNPEDLARHPEPQRLRLGAHLSEEQVVRNDPSFAFEAAQADRPAIEAALGGAEVLLLVAGLGGGTGAGGSRALAQIAHERGLPVMALVTRPFSLEGELRLQRARAAARQLSSAVDQLVSFHQDQLLPLAEKGSRVHEMISIADEFVGHALAGLVDLVKQTSSADDLRPLLGAADGLASFGVSDTPGDLTEAAGFAAAGPFLQAVELSHTDRLLVSIRSREPLTADQLAEASTALRGATRENAKVTFVQKVVSDLDHEVHLTAIALGEFGVPHPRLEGFFVPGPTG